MKKQYFILLFIFFWAVFLSHAQNFTPIALNPNPVSASCIINNENFQVTTPSEVLSGDLFGLNITLPGNFDENCVISIHVTYSASSGSVYFVSSPLSFSQSGNSLTLNDSIPGNDGFNFNLLFRFPNNTTCDGTTGTFNITFEACGQTCSTSLQVTARAGNYWTVEKEYVSGNLVCGISKWKLVVRNHNPNPSNYGNYSLSGTFTENPSLNVAGNSVFTFTNLNGVNGSISQKFVYLYNCQNAGTVITNSADYNFTLGNNCETMAGTVTAESDTLAAPNTDISFTKYIHSTSGYVHNSNNVQGWSSEYDITPGCQGRFILFLKNTGNVPWSNISINDNLNIPGLTIEEVILPPGWTSTPALPQSNLNQYFTFNAPAGFVLLPGNSVSVIIDFTVDSNVPPGSIITNVAMVNYSASGGGGSNQTGGNSNSTNCPGVNCPVLDTTVQNISDTAKIYTINPVSVPRIYKWLINYPPNKIYQVGDTIEFRLELRNYGSADLTTTVTDALNSSGQNLNLIPGSMTYRFYEWNAINNSFDPPVSPPFVSPFGIVDNSTVNNINIDVNNMPGTCEYSKYNKLVMEFQAIVMPQIYGSKTNKAYMNNQHGSANYYIDQVGILEVNKYADSEFVDNGGNFNYIIEVTNSGSVPLDQIVIDDSFPDCSNLNGHIQVTDISGNVINATTTGNLQIQIDPAYVLNPGQNLTITIPATKNGGGQCCNVSVHAQSRMTTSGVQLEANYGSQDEPAACVKSTECCDIPDFNAQLSQGNNGTYQLTIQGGQVPLQEVNVTLLDYHVEYNNEDCKPAFTGVYGLLSTTNVLLGGLTLDSISNNSHGLSWTSGNPSIINNTVDLSIMQPDVLNLDCCDVEFYFCLKVQVKDVNCNTCEKIVCAEPAQACELTMDEIPKEVCAGEDISISWNGNSNTTAEIMLTSPNSSPVTIATNQSVPGNLIYTLPDSLCGKRYQILVTTGECQVQSNVFMIKCCETACDCGEWTGQTITITKNAVIDHDSQPAPEHRKRNSMKNKNASCGDNIELITGNYQFEPPAFSCDPDVKDCQAEFNWHLTSVANQVDHWYTGNVFSYNFNQEGSYLLKVYPKCGDQVCEPCVVRLTITDCKPYCEMYEDFNDQSTGNWQVINGTPPNAFSQFLFIRDLSGASWMYNSNYPSNLIEAGCALEYDVKYYAGENNSNNTDNSLVIYSGSSPATATVKAAFVLHNSARIPNDGNFHHIIVPLQIATGNTLPGNSFGEWRINGSNTVTPAQRLAFNNLIQNASGIAFFLDEGANPAEEWYYDNFCFRQCCKSGGTGYSGTKPQNN